MQRLAMRSQAKSCVSAASISLRSTSRTSQRSVCTVYNLSAVERRSEIACSSRILMTTSRTFMNSSNITVNTRNSSRANSIRFFSSYPSHTVVPMPSLSPTMESGSIANWMLKEGDKFEAGTAICEVETDKATVTYDATEEGYIAKILVGAGELKVGVPMMITVDDFADVAAFANYTLDSAAAPAAAPVVAPSPAPVVAASPAPVAVAAAPVAVTGRRVVASPLARKLLRDAGLPSTALEGIVGTGAGGRVVSTDVLASIAAGVPAAAAPAVHAATSVSAAPVAVAPTQVSTIPGVYQDFELSDLARAVAARQTACMQQVPHYYLSVELNLAKLLALRDELNASRGKTGAELSVLDFVVKASALAVEQVPDVNASWMDKFVRRYQQVDINLVMGTGSGLVTPVLRDVQARGLGSISKEIGGFEDSLFNDSGAEIASAQMAVGTFSIHNLGMYGVKSASPIVLAPQACALALGAIIDTVVPRVGGKEGDDDWVVAPVMVATLSCDHRVVDGAVGAQWLAALKTLLENPSSMLL